MIVDRANIVERLRSFERRSHVRVDADAARLYFRVPTASRELARRVIESLADAAGVERRFPSLPPDSERIARGVLEALAIKAVADDRSRLRIGRRSQETTTSVGVR